MFNVCLTNPWVPRNVGEALRISKCFGADKVYMTGTRVALEGDGKKYRLPREERMRGVYDRVWPTERPFDENRGLTPVAVELVDGFEDINFFDHPEDALYVFGPEDGSLGRAELGQCHRFVRIPTTQCLSLPMAITAVLFHRNNQRVLAGEDSLTLGRREGTL